MVWRRVQLFLVRRCVTHGMDFSLDGSHDVAEDVFNLQLE
jgi:hypothetical protein